MSDSMLFTDTAKSTESESRIVRSPAVHLPVESQLQYYNENLSVPLVSRHTFVIPNPRHPTEMARMTSNMPNCFYYNDFEPP
jgi:hypothetical protein